MFVTPTYWTFWLYRPFQGATSLPVTLQSPDYVAGTIRQPAVDITAARGADGKIHVALVNVDPREEVAIHVGMPGAGAVSGQILTAATMDSRNSFAAPDAVRPHPFAGAAWKNGSLQLTLPARSLVVLELSGR
jgi:alpha-N-arabinofuranosidase